MASIIPGPEGLSLANGAGPLHDEDDEEPENAVVLHEVCAGLRCVASTEPSLAGSCLAIWQESTEEATRGGCTAYSLVQERHCTASISAPSQKRNVSRAAARFGKQRQRKH